MVDCVGVSKPSNLAIVMVFHFSRLDGEERAARDLVVGGASTKAAPWVVRDIGRGKGFSRGKLSLSKPTTVMLVGIVVVTSSVLGLRVKTHCVVILFGGVGAPVPLDLVLVSSVENFGFPCIVYFLCAF
jgi:hypothetical protein